MLTRAQPHQDLRPVWCLDEVTNPKQRQRITVKARCRGNTKRRKKRTVCNQKFLKNKRCSHKCGTSKEKLHHQDNEQPQSSVFLFQTVTKDKNRLEDQRGRGAVEKIVLESNQYFKSMFKIVDKRYRKLCIRKVRFVNATKTTENHLFEARCKYIPRPAVEISNG